MKVSSLFVLIISVILAAPFASANSLDTKICYAYLNLELGQFVFSNQAGFGAEVSMSCLDLYFSNNELIVGKEDVPVYLELVLTKADLNDTYLRLQSKNLTGYKVSASYISTDLVRLKIEPNN